MPNFKTGDKVKYNDKELLVVVPPYGGHQGVAEHLNEGSGWQRDESIPNDYVSKGTNNYWYMKTNEGWKLVTPTKMPLGKEVSLEQLAKAELSGGQIKNAILQAARLALGADMAHVTTEHFTQAISRLKKSKNLMGKTSRYRQGDYQMSTGVTKKPSDITKFLNTD